MESKDPTVFTKTYEEGVERVLKVKLQYKYIYIGLRYRNHPYPLGWSEKPKSWKSKNGQADYFHVTAPMSEQFSKSRSDR